MPNFILHFRSPCPDKTVFDTQPCWPRSSLLCNPSSVRQWITCKKVIHCCLTGGWEHANGTSLQTPHMLNSVTKDGFGSEFMLFSHCSCAMNAPTATPDLLWCEITITPTGSKRASTQATAREPLLLHQLKMWVYLNFQHDQISFILVPTFSCNISFLPSLSRGSFYGQNLIFFFSPFCEKIIWKHIFVHPCPIPVSCSALSSVLKNEFFKHTCPKSIYSLLVLFP